MEQFKHLYINPLEECNLRCQMCYTQKIKDSLSQAQILDFIDRYRERQVVETVTYCGGEVFLRPDFPEIVNQTIERGIFTQIITNGTLDRLELIAEPNFCNLIVSMDGLPEFHDQNRGRGNFERSLAYLKKAQSLGFHREVFSIVTRQNLEQITAFEAYLNEQLGEEIAVTYHPRKPLTYLTAHPTANTVGTIAGFDFLLPEELVELRRRKKVFPPPELGCFQIAVMADGQVYGCCEGRIPLGKVSDDPEVLRQHLAASLDFSGLKGVEKCAGCADGAFKCGLE